MLFWGILMVIFWQTTRIQTISLFVLFGKKHQYSRSKTTHLLIFCQNCLILLLFYHFLKFTQSAFFEKNSHVPDSHIFRSTEFCNIIIDQTFYLHNKHIIIKLKSLKISHYPVFFIYAHNHMQLSSRKIEKICFFQHF